MKRYSVSCLSLTLALLCWTQACKTPGENSNVESEGSGVAQDNAKPASSPEGKFADFFQSVEADLPIKLNFLRDISTGIHLAGPSYLEEKGIINGTAAASYNSVLNALVLKEDLLTSMGSRSTILGTKQTSRVSTIQEMFVNPDIGIGYTNKVKTIMHELAHAEYDLQLFDSKDPMDRKISLLFNQEIAVWLRLAFPNMSVVTKTIALSEIFAYYREEIITNYYSDIDVIAMDNGFSQYDGRCFSTPSFKEKLRTGTRENFLKFESDSINDATPYSKRVALNSVFVLGEEIDLQKSPIGPFPTRFKDALWSHFEYHFKPAKNKRELMQFLNAKSTELSRFNLCRTKMWNDAHSSNSPTVSAPK